MRFDKYERLGDYHWREYARGTVYRAYVDGLRNWVNPGRCLLDVGAGDGLIAHLLGATGVELDATAVRLARAHGVDVRQGDAAALPFGDESFDSVLLGDVIEHLEDPQPALAEARRVLTLGGRLYITTPPEATPVRPYHYREYTPRSLAALVLPAGFVLETEPFTRHDRIHAVFAKA